MKYTRDVKSWSRGVLTLLAIALIATMAVGQDLVIGGGGTFTGGGQYHIKGNISNNAAVTINGVVTLEGTAAQVIGTATKGDINFQTLNVNTTVGSATMAVSTAVSSGLSIAAGSTFNIQNNTLDVGGTSTRNGTGTLTTGATSIVNFTGTSAQTVLGGVTYNGDLNLSGTGAKVIDATVTAGKNFNASSNITIAGSGTLAFGGTANGTISGDLVNNGTITAPASGLIIFGGAGQNISGSNSIAFNNVTFAGTGAKNVNTGISISSGGQLAVNQPLIMSGSNALTMKAGALQPSFAGQTEITGSMAWEATSAQTYIFNNASTEIAFTAPDAGRTLMLKSQPSVNPTDYSLAHTVNRKFNVIFANSSSTTVNVKLAYLQGEGSSLGVTESKLKDFQNGIAASKKVSGTPTRLTSGAGSFGYVTANNITSAQLLAANELALDDRFSIFKSIAGATNWDVAGSWDANAVPGGTDDVEIDGSYAVTIPTGVSAAANYVLIDQGSGTSGGLTLSGTAGLAVGSGGLINNNSTGAGLNVGSGTSVTITTGTLTNNGAITNAGTIRVQ
ncbi:MAG: hypothetical protein NTX44_03745 [Ignavibacteriales bacterium]|nr:hypothetical protein [Ignavibacteriales bacterium]